MENLYKILIVEDDRVSRLVLNKILKPLEQCTITEAVNGLEAWKLLDEGFFPDLMISDISMPEMDGLELLEKVRRDSRFENLPAIMCTALNDKNSVMSALAQGRINYIIKPYSAEKMRKCVTNELDKKSRKSNGNFTEVSKRLGISLEDYLELKNLLTEDIKGGIEKLKDNWANIDFEQLAIKFNALKSSALSLGEDELSVTLASIEDAINSGNFRRIQGLTEQLDHDVSRKEAVDSVPAQ